MRDTPFFSMIMPVYNRAARVESAVVSVNNQTFTDWELIIVDDCSTDNTWEVLQQFKSEKVRLLRNEKNAERCITRNNGIREAKGAYITFLDSDDYHLPEHLQELYLFIQEKRCPEAFFFTNAFNEQENGNRGERYCPTLSGVDPLVYFLRYTVNPQRWAVHQKVIAKHLFDPNINICEDMDVSLRIANTGVPVYQLEKRTTCYVAAKDSFTQSDSQKWERELQALKKIFDRAELKDKLPLKERWRLLSMCHFHLASKAFEQHGSAPFWKHAFPSLFLYPPGYNGKTTWPLFVMMVHRLPFIGNFVRTIKHGST